MTAELFATFDSALQALADPKELPSVAQLRALSGATAANMAGWAAVWPALPPQRRQWVAGQLAALAEDDVQVSFKPQFVFLLDDPDAQVRATAIDGLWEAQDLFLMDRFVHFLAHDAAAPVRARAAAALGTFLELGELERIDIRRTRQVLLALLDAANDEGEDLEVRRRATESAGFADSPQVRALITDAIASPERPLRAAALRAMGNSADERWAEEVLAGLEDPDPGLRFEAAHAAGELALAAAVPLLADLAGGDDREVQIEAIWALGEIGGDAGRRALERLAGDVAEDEDLAEAFEAALATAMLSAGLADLEDAAWPLANGKWSGNGEAPDEEWDVWDEPEDWAEDEDEDETDGDVFDDELADPDDERSGKEER